MNNNQALQYARYINFYTMFHVTNWLHETEFFLRKNFSASHEIPCILWIQNIQYHV